MITTVLPVIIAGAALPTKNKMGTFQGIMAATTPYGWRIVIFTKPGVFKLDVPRA